MDTDESSTNFTWRQNFVRNILRHLKESGQKKGDFAKAADVVSGTVSAWLSGETEPEVGSLWGVADALKQSMDNVVGRRPPGSDLLERYRTELLARAEKLMQEATDLLAIAEALNQVLPSEDALRLVLPSEIDNDASAATTQKPKPAPKNGRKKAKKVKKPKNGRKAKKKTPPKS